MSTALFGYIAFVLCVVWWVYSAFSSGRLFQSKQSIPPSFQHPYKAISRCINYEMMNKVADTATIDNRLGMRCFVANKDDLLNVAQEAFNPLVKESYEKYVNTRKQGNKPPECILTSLTDVLI
jgi:hypothetical protein